MTIRSKKIKQIISKIEAVSDEDLKKVEAYVDDLNPKDAIQMEIKH